MNRDFLRNIALAAAVFLLVLYASRMLMPPLPPRPVGDGSAASSGDGTQPAAPASAPAAGGPAIPDGAAPATTGDAPPAGFSVLEAPEATSIVIGATFDGSDPKAKPGDDPYRMRLKLSNIGASIESAAMTDHKAVLHRPDRYTLLSPVGSEAGKQFRSLAIEKINIGLPDASGALTARTDIALHDRRWHVQHHQTTDQGEEVAFALEVQKDGAAILRLVRTFVLPRQAIGERRHDLRADLTIQNLSGQALDVIVTSLGGLGVPREDTRADDRVVDYGTFSTGQVSGKRLQASSIPQTGTEVKPLFSDATAAPGEKFSWAATANKYFTCTLAPLSEAGDTLAADVAHVEALALDPSSTDLADVTVRFVTRPLSIAAGTARTLPTTVYLGDKDGSAFKKVVDYRARNYYFQVGANVGWCTFPMLVDMMVALLGLIYYVVPNYGVAIMVLVFIVRFLLHPITKKGQVNMVRMQKRMGDFSPKMEEIKRKFGNDKTRQQQEMMKLYREEGINPAGQMLTCLPMLLQTPIWIALFISLSYNVAMRHQPFAFWIKDLSAPDALIKFAVPWNLPLFGQIASFNLLPFLVSMAMFVQQKTMPKPKPNPNASAEQRQQQEMMQKMMPIMSVMMLFIFYNMPSGLTLYIMSSTLLGTIEQWRIRAHIRRHEDAGTLHKPGRRKGPGDGSAGRGGGFMGHMLARLQMAADDAKKTPQGGKVKR